MPSKVDMGQNKQQQQQALTNSAKDETTAKAEGVYVNQNICRLVMLLVGHEVQLETKDGRLYDGIFTTCSPKFQVALSIVHELAVGGNNQALPQKDKVTEKMIFECDDIVSIKSRSDIDFGVRGFATDAEIARTNNGEVNAERELEPWVDDMHSMDYDIGAENDHHHGNWSVHDMFKKNEELGVTSTFEENLSQYTTVSVDDSHPEYAAQRAKAERIAQLIEENPRSRQAADLENEDAERDLDGGHGGGYQTVGRGGRYHNRDRNRGGGGDRRGRGGQRGGPGGNAQFHGRGNFNQQRGGYRGGFGHERSPGAQQHAAQAPPNTDGGGPAFNQWVAARQQQQQPPGQNRQRRSNENPGQRQGGGGQFDTFPRRGGPRGERSGKFGETKEQLKEWGKDFNKAYTQPSQDTAGPSIGVWQQEPPPRPREQRQEKTTDSAARPDDSAGPRSSPTAILPRPSSTNSGGRPSTTTTSPPREQMRAPEMQEKTPEPGATTDDEATSSEKKFHFNIHATVFTPRSQGSTGALTPNTPQQPQSAASNGAPPVVAYPSASPSPAGSMQAASVYQTYPYPVQGTHGQGIYANAPPAHISIQNQMMATQPTYSIAYQPNNPAQMVLTSNANRPRRPLNQLPLHQQQVVGQPLITPTAPYPPQLGTAPPQPIQLIPVAAGQYPPQAANSGYQPQYVMKPQSLASGAYQNYVLPHMAGEAPGAFGVPQLGPPPSMGVQPNGGPGSSSGATASNNASQPPTPGPQTAPSPAYPQASATPQSPQYPPPAQMYPTAVQPGGQMVMLPPMAYVYSNQHVASPYGTMGFAQQHPLSNASAHPNITDSYAHAQIQGTGAHLVSQPVPSLIRSASMPMSGGPPYVVPPPHTNA